MAEEPSYYTDNPFQILRQKRHEADERRRAAFEAKYGPTRILGVRPPAGRDLKDRWEMALRHRDNLRRLSVRLLIAQDNRCYLCGDPFGATRPATRDHVFPQALGGRDRHNILMAHQPCNNAKGERAPTRDELAYLRAVNVAMANDEVAPRVFRCAAE